MKKIIRKYSILFLITLIMIIASIILLFLSYKIGIAETGVKDIPGFIEKTNWSLQILFWPIFALLIHYGWYYYKIAWINLPSQNLIWKNEDIIDSSDATVDIIKSLNQKRIYLVFSAIILGLIFTMFDAGCLWNEYGVLENSQNCCSEKDFSIAFRLKEFPEVNKNANGWFVFAAYLMQGGLIAYAWLAFLQLLIHSYSFLIFEKLSSNKKKYKIFLNYRDPLREYGLTDVNRAINITYVFIAFAMVLPVLSAYENKPIIPDDGQLLLRILLPLILLLPAAIPIVERVRRKQDINIKIINDNNPESREDNDKQQLWPFEKTEIGYIGKAAALIAVGEYYYIITKNLDYILG